MLLQSTAMEDLLAHCAASFSQHRGLFAAFFIGGLTSGFTHCLAMCGPVVAGQAACAGSCGSKMNSSQLSYHLGRITVYGALGFAAALLAKQVAALPYWPFISAAMLVGAGVMFIAGSLPPRKSSLCNISTRNNYLRGMLMGFMPCGVLYAALMMAATLTDPLQGMVAMWLFTIGTIPALLLASGSAALFSIKWKYAMHNIGRMVMAVNGVSLLVMATRIMR